MRGDAQPYPRRAAQAAAEAEAEAEAEAAAPDEALAAVDPISAGEQDVRAQAALATFDEVGRVYAALLETGLTMLYISYAHRVDGAAAAAAFARGRTRWTVHLEGSLEDMCGWIALEQRDHTAAGEQWTIDSYTMDAEFAHLLLNKRTPVARAVEIVGLKRAVISRINEEGAVFDGELRLRGSYMRAAPGSNKFWLAWLTIDFSAN
ncbi:hypothetical protein T492DRAFT_895676 [Pavlovales sp. CCMP2436]|nr:hypothetical protein T492DRAFT_895676 [Pavlovales sp. CCMP2436]